MFEQASKRGLRELLDNRSKFITGHSSSGHKSVAARPHAEDSASSSRCVLRSCRHALEEAMADPAVAAKMSDTKGGRARRRVCVSLAKAHAEARDAAYGEVRALQEFLEMMNTDPDRAFYGFNHVRKANEMKAIDTLLVTDSLFRCGRAARCCRQLTLSVAQQRKRQDAQGVRRAGTATARASRAAGLRRNKRGVCVCAFRWTR
jgi:protein pelota